ncbi:hypothetical protein ACFLUM_03535 [Chloroflexota bacterium]
MRRFSDNNLILWGAVGVVAVLAVVLLWTTGAFRVTNPKIALAGTAQALEQASPSPSPTATSTPEAPAALGTEAASVATATALPGPTVGLPALPDITPPPGGQIYELTPESEAAGWVSDGDDQANHLGDYNIYAGVFDGQRHLGAIQFDISSVPIAAPIVYADLTLFGLSEEWLHNDGLWAAQVLESWMDVDWPERTYSDLALDEGITAELEQTLTASDLAAGRANQFTLGPEALDALYSRTFTGRVSFRIEGPASGPNSLFAWDSGYGTGSRGWRPVLRIVAGPGPDELPLTPTPDYTIITSTPTPENAVTEAAIAATAAVISTTTGTVTPLPPNWVTPVILVPTPTPENIATAQWHAMLATAEAFLRGTPTPQPPNVWTATPTPTGYAVVVTIAPTPRSWATAIAQAEADATRWLRFGTPTPFPPYVVTATPRYVVVTSTPTPENYATAQARAARATIVALTTGTFTPVPENWVSARPTPRPTPMPLLVPFNRLTPTTTPRPTPNLIPDRLRGKIAFKSDRLGTPELFVMDPDGSHVSWLTQSYPYDAARAGEPISPNGRWRVIVQADDRRQLQLFLYQPSHDRIVSDITRMEGDAYDPAWAPDRDVIVFVSTASGNDEIYAVNVDRSDLRRLTTNTWEWDKHPSWSPDGKQIAFFSNRSTGRTQIWVMNADGSKERNISDNRYNDWDPVWIK